MRLDYVPNPPTNLSSEDQEVLERVKARRGARGLIPLDLTLLHAPKIADGECIAPKWRTLGVSLIRLERAPWGRSYQEFITR